MRFLHVSDLHLGKALHAQDMLADQAHALDRILELAAGSGADAILVAGDVYDRSVPSVQAVALFDSFLARALALRPGMRVVVVPGNHDSGGRLGWCSELLARSGLHIRSGLPEAPEFVHTEARGETRDETRGDQNGELRRGAVAVWALPFLGPGLFGQTEQGLSSQQDLMERALAGIRARLDPAAMNILVAHCFVTGGISGESERAFVGAAESVDAALFEGFDYVALGHLHRPQAVGAGAVAVGAAAGAVIRYSGAPLAYSFGEVGQEKGVFIVDISPGGAPAIDFAPIPALHPLRRLRGTFAELESAVAFASAGRDDYIEAVVTDPMPVLGAYERLRVVYPNLLNTRLEAFERAPGSGSGPGFGADRGEGEGNVAPPGSEQAVRSDFSEFCRTMNGDTPTGEMSALFESLLDEAFRAAD